MQNMMLWLSRIMFLDHKTVIKHMYEWAQHKMHKHHESSLLLDMCRLGYFFPIVSWIIPLYLCSSDMDHPRVDSIRKCILILESGDLQDVLDTFFDFNFTPSKYWNLYFAWGNKHSASSGGGSNCCWCSMSSTKRCKKRLRIIKTSIM